MNFDTAMRVLFALLAAICLAATIGAYVAMRLKDKKEESLLSEEKREPKHPVMRVLFSPPYVYPLLAVGAVTVVATALGQYLVISVSVMYFSLLALAAKRDIVLIELVDSRIELENRSAVLTHYRRKMAEAALRLRAADQLIDKWRNDDEYIFRETAALEFEAALRLRTHPDFSPVFEKLTPEELDEANRYLHD
jgi:hypothetical protein